MESERQLPRQFCEQCGTRVGRTAHYCAACGTSLGDGDGPDSGVVDGVVGEARVAAQAGDPVAARQLLLDALYADPDDSAARLALAALLLQGGRWDEGLAELERLREQLGWSPVVEAYVGGAQLGLGQVAAAKETLDSAAAFAPADFFVQLKRGELYCRLGIYEVAVTALESAQRGQAPDAAAQAYVEKLLAFSRDKRRQSFVRTSARRLAEFVRVRTRAVPQLPSLLQAEGSNY